MAGDEIVMPENAFLMIHDPAGVAMGTAIDMRAMAEALDKCPPQALRVALFANVTAAMVTDPAEVRRLRGLGFFGELRGG